MLPPIAKQLAPGTTARTALSVEDPETGAPTSIPVLLARGSQDGPALLLVGAQHGTEVSGPAAIHLLFRHLDLADLRGLVVAAPVANPPAARIKRQAYPTDHGWTENCPENMNRAWPGDAAGTLVQRMAAALWEQCVEPCHAVIDFHSHSPQYGPLTLVRATSDASLAIAQAFGVAHIQMVRDTRGGHLYDVAARDGKAAIVVELPPLRLVDPKSVRLALAGIRNVMANLRMTGREQRPTEVALAWPESESRMWYAPTDGIVLAYVDPGALVQEGKLVAELVSVHDFSVVEEVVAPFRGVVSMLGCPMKYIDSYDVDIASRGALYARMVRCDL
jgi:predicted deacylase